MTSRIELDREGFALLDSDIAHSTLDVAGKVGAIVKVDSMPAVQTLTPRNNEDEPLNTYSGNFGLREFPFHTDMAHWFVPPRYLLLRCIVPAKEVATCILHSSALMSDGLRSPMRRALFRPRRKLNNKSYLLRLIQNEMFRWDSVFIRAANQIAEVVRIEIEKQLSVVSSRKIVLDAPGTCLLIDNWKALHGRTTIPNHALSRKIERVYLSEVWL